MPSPITHSTLLQDCSLTLNRVLDLAMHTAEAANAEGDHKVVLQAVWEVIRIITLINKMAVTSEPGLGSLLDPGLPLTGAGAPGILAVKSPPDLKTANQEPKTANRLSEKREKSGKLPAKTSPKKEIKEEFQAIMVSQKNTGKNSPSWRKSTLPGPSPAADSGSWLEELATGRLDITSLHAIGAGRRLPDSLAALLL